MLWWAWQQARRTPWPSQVCAGEGARGTPGAGQEQQQHSGCAAAAACGQTQTFQLLLLISDVQYVACTVPVCAVWSAWPGLAHCLLLQLFHVQC
jgi:hypothetical protein